MSLVTPSTRLATSGPNSASTSSSEALVSSTVSWSSAAHSVSESSRRLAQILATPSGWVMKSSPERRRWSACRSRANVKARSTGSRSIPGACAACSATTANRSSSSARLSASSGAAGAALVVPAARPAVRRRPPPLPVAPVSLVPPREPALARPPAFPRPPTARSRSLARRSRRPSAFARPARRRRPALAGLPRSRPAARAWLCFRDLRHEHEFSAARGAAGDATRGSERRRGRRPGARVDGR